MATQFFLLLSLTLTISMEECLTRESLMTTVEAEFVEVLPLVALLLKMLLTAVRLLVVPVTGSLNAGVLILGKV